MGDSKWAGVANLRSCRNVAERCFQTRWAPSRYTWSSLIPINGRKYIGNWGWFTPKNNGVIAPHLEASHVLIAYLGVRSTPHQDGKPNRIQ